MTVDLIENDKHPKSSDPNAGFVTQNDGNTKHGRIKLSDGPTPVLMECNCSGASTKQRQSNLVCLSCRRPDGMRLEAAPSASASTASLPSVAASAAATPSSSSAPKASPPLRCDQLPPTIPNDPIAEPEGVAVIELAIEAEAGVRKLVRLWADHPFSPGGDPAFTLHAAGWRNGFPSHLIFPPEVLAGTRFEWSPNQGHTLYVFEGRFSGRDIDYYEWHRRQHGVEADPTAIEDELRAKWSKEWPGFCVRSWCYVPDPTPDSLWLPKDGKRIREQYAQVVQRLKDAGALRCADVRHPNSMPTTGATQP